MSDTMNDDVSSRFRAIWVGLLALLSFGILSAVVVCMTSKDSSTSDPVTELRAKKRSLIVAAVDAAQEELVEKAAKDDASGTVRLPVDEAARLVAPQLKAKKAAASQTVVPGSPTQIKQSQQATPAVKEGEPEKEKQAAPAPSPAPAPVPKPETKPATPAPKPEAKPTTPAPAPAAKPTAAPKPAADKPATPKPATEKPATPKPATEKPAAPKPATPKPATPAPAPAKPAPTPAPKPPAPAAAN